LDPAGQGAITWERVRRSPKVLSSGQPTGGASRRGPWSRLAMHRRGHTDRYGLRGDRRVSAPRLADVPFPAEVVVVVLIGLVVLLSLRIMLAVPGWVRHVRRPESRAIRVVGVGGGGNNAVDRMVAAGIRDVSFVGFNTDAQALRRSTAGLKIRIGETTTGGLGAGTGSGAAPIVAGIARDQGALTIAVVTKPFEFEGSQRGRVADAAATELAGKVDALIVVPNDRVGDVLSPDASVVEAFGVVDDVLLHAVEGII